MLGSARSNPSKGVPMLATVDSSTMFREVKLSTTDPKIKVRVNQCTTCAALVPSMDRLKHRRFHDDVRAIARHVGLSR
jgi:hypothetical protein